MIITKYLSIHKLNENKYLLINSLSGALDIIDEHTKEELTQQNLPKGDLIRKTLKDRQYIFDNEVHEKSVFLDTSRFLEYIYSKESNKVGFLICPTYSCNFRCTYCFQSDKMHQMEEVMSIERINAAFEAIDEYLLDNPHIKEFNIQLFGGEPLQPKTKKAVEYIIKLAAQRQTTVTIITNGFYSEFFIDILSEYKEKIYFQITIDGLPEIHNKRRILPNGKGTFNKIISNIDLLLNRGFGVRIRMNLDKLNLDYVPQTLEFYEQRGWTSMSNFICSMAPVTNHNCIPDRNVSSEFEILKHLMDLYPDLGNLKNRYKVTFGPDMFRTVGHISRICNPNIFQEKSLPAMLYCEAAQLKNIAMGPDGLLYVCGEALGEEAFSVGRFYPKFDLDKEKINKWKNRTIFNMEECSVCNIATLCGGGCPLAASKFNGNPNTPFCGQTRETLDKFINLNKDKFLQMVGE